MARGKGEGGRMGPAFGPLGLSLVCPSGCYVTGWAAEAGPTRPCSKCIRLAAPTTTNTNPARHCLPKGGVATILLTHEAGQSWQQGDTQAYG